MKFFRHSLIVFISLMVFLTSSGLTVNLHYCAGKLQQISMKQHTADCMMKMNSQNTSCEKTLKKPNNCCKDQLIKAKLDLKINDTKNDSGFLKTIFFVQSYFVSLFKFEEPAQSNEQDTSTSIFPLLKEGLYILLQQFRN